jgi:hypothetical protein
MRGLESSRIAASADTNLNPGPEWATLNETAEPYRVFPGLVVAETLGA